jgi:PAT family beta-lactamase induction signal transducer AmpG
MSSASPPPTAAAESASRQRRPGTWASLRAAMTSWRTASVALLSFSSGMPLGLVWIAIPDWMRSIGVDLRVVGLITLAQAPWTFKFLWSPFMDRWAPPFFGRRRGWMAIALVALFATTLALAGVGSRPETPWVVGALALAVAFTSATYDIAYDAYTVDVLRPEEQGPAVGAKIALYRAAMYAAGAIAITVAALWSWPAVLVVLAVAYLPFLFVTVRAPEPEEPVVAPRTLRAAVWEPFLGLLSRPRALEILLFVLCYKLADNLAQALLRPFLVDMGYSAFDRGVALGTAGAVATSAGALLGGVLTTSLGLGRALWLFGVIQILSNLGYILVAGSPVNPPLMYGAMGFESFTQGLGTGAFLVLLLRLTEKRFSATQYALLSSLFGIPRLLTGPISGFAADAMGWTPFFWLTMAAGIPGLVLLARFVPIGAREPVLTSEPGRPVGPPLGAGALAARGVVAGAVALGSGALMLATLDAVKAVRATAGAAFDLAAPLEALLRPQGVGDWLGLVGLLAFAAVCGLFAAAVAAARRGMGARATARAD